MGQLRSASKWEVAAEKRAGKPQHGKSHQSSTFIWYPVTAQNGIVESHSAQDKFDNGNAHWHLGHGDDSSSNGQLLLGKVVEMAAALKPGTEPGQMGPVIDANSKSKILSYINASEESGAEILLDGRDWQKEQSGGEWIGPTIIKHNSSSDKAVKEEIFGPVLSVVSVKTWQEAIAIENSNPFGNAACIYTSSGSHANWFTSRFRASMLGVNIGIPVPREPFSFGGLYGTKSKYGDMDITGDGAMEFFSNRIKVSSRWPAPQAPEYTTGQGSGAVVMNGVNGTTDHANFNGRI